MLTSEEWRKKLEERENETKEKEEQKEKRKVEREQKKRKAAVMKVKILPPKKRNSLGQNYIRQEPTDDVNVRQEPATEDIDFDTNMESVRRQYGKCPSPSENNKEALRH